MVFCLRPDQETVLEAARAALRRRRRPLIQAPTGFGKTVLSAAMFRGAAEKRNRAFFIVHRQELIEQSRATFSMVGIDHSVIAAGYPFNPGAMVQICSIDTLRRRLDRVEPPRVVVWDECHHLAAATWGRVQQHYADAFHVGLSATPARLDGRGLGDHFDELVRGPSVRWLIEGGHLARYKLYAPAAPDLGGVSSVGGDYQKAQLAAAMDSATVVGSAVDQYRRRAPGARAVAFCVSVEHARHTREAFAAAGIRAEVIDGTMDRGARSALIERFRGGDLRVLCSVDLISEGFDLPAMECAILLRPTKSLGLYLQQVGRALRTAPGKTHAVILDHAGNALAHGLPDDEREWTLDGVDRKPKQREASVRQCASCFAVAPPSAETCPECGTPFPRKPRMVEEVEGDLAEVDADALRARREAARAEQSRARTLDELIALGRSRGYRSPERWAAQVFTYRQQRARGRERSYA